MLTVLRRIAEFDRELRKGVWSTQPIARAKGRTLGVVGLGAIGQRVAQLGRVLGMEVLAWTYGDDGGRAANFGAHWVDLDELLGRADVISLHLRLTDATRGLIDARRFGPMKRDAVLMNTARAALVDRAALLTALSSEKIAGAGLDVFHDEPLPSNDPLLDYSNVVMTPHCGGNIPDVMERAIATST
jgi:phosphoglycerate dehydrogenase-like enzyme